MRTERLVEIAAGAATLAFWLVVIGLTYAFSPHPGRDVDWTAVVLFVLLLACVTVGALLPPRLWSAALLWGAFAVLLTSILLTVTIPEALPSLLFALIAAVLGTHVTIKDWQGNRQIQPS